MQYCPVKKFTALAGSIFITISVFLDLPTQIESRPEPEGVEVHAEPVLQDVVHAREEPHVIA